MNKVIMKGNVVRDFNFKDAGEYHVAWGTLALNRGKDKDGNDRGADFPNIVAYGHNADFLNRFGKKGRAFLIEARIRTGSHDDEETGKKTYTTSFVVERIEFADSKKEDETAQEPSNTVGDGFIPMMNLPDDNDMPFK